MKYQAHRLLWAWEYRGYFVHKPDGSKHWNIRKMDGEDIDFCFTTAICASFKEAKATIDNIIRNA